LSARQIVKRLVTLAREEAYANGYASVTGIHIRLGWKESISEEDLLLAFGQLEKDNLIKDAQLFIKRGNALAKCRYCGNIFEVDHSRNRCAECGSTYVKFIGNRGISLEKVDGLTAAEC
jgi:hydrogenase nickel incorporation protein HypA/HybF